ncbi:hypothetical protein EVAR_48821_1 [Eumeta japonica]|uniref:Uncharacterized protein n=1 Tax=Eumeta variegata TaxID=151549 RepID=A0A4C1Y246_EUMVA|nr:hypothetical protein EVAR_48821_1 [Eumeta japonica]
MLGQRGRDRVASHMVQYLRVSGSSVVSLSLLVDVSTFVRNARRRTGRYQGAGDRLTRGLFSSGVARRQIAYRAPNHFQYRCHKRTIEPGDKSPTRTLSDDDEPLAQLIFRRKSVPSPKTSTSAQSQLLSIAPASQRRPTRVPMHQGPQLDEIHIKCLRQRPPTQELLTAHEHRRDLIARRNHDGGLNAIALMPRATVTGISYKVSGLNLMCLRMRRLSSGLRIATCCMPSAMFRV